MTHEPECRVAKVDPSAYDYDERDYYDCCCTDLRAAYRRGYNDHARTVQHWQDTHGAYRQKDGGTP